MPVQGGWDTFEKLTAKDPMLAVIIITARPNQLFTALGAGVGALLEKPLDFPRLLRTVSLCWRNPRSCGSPASSDSAPISIIFLRPARKCRSEPRRALPRFRFFRSPPGARDMCPIHGPATVRHDDRQNRRGGRRFNSTAPGCRSNLCKLLVAHTDATVVAALPAGRRQPGRFVEWSADSLLRAKEDLADSAVRAALLPTDPVAR